MSDMEITLWLVGIYVSGLLLTAVLIGAVFAAAGDDDPRGLSATVTISVLWPVMLLVTVVIGVPAGAMWIGSRIGRRLS